MRLIWINRRLFLALAVCVAAATVPALAQKGGGSPPAGNTAPSNSPSRSPLPTTNNNPSNFPRNTSPSTSLSTPIFLSGKVLFDDGSPANPNIRIERVCGVTTRLEAHTDSKGRFSFQLGQNNAVDEDASDSGWSRSTNSGFGSSMGRSGFGSNNLANCELRASFPGYRSDVVALNDRRALDNPDVGTIILHRLANVQGTTMSATTLAAPKHSQKEYEKGLQFAAKGKFDEAEERLTEATSSYPKYAIAWFALGEVQHREGKTEDARKAYHAAVAADPKYVSPYEQLALLSAQEGKWEDAANFSRQALDLNSIEFPGALWYNAVANYNLKKVSDSEKSLRQLLQSDTGHRFPAAENLLGQILIDKGDLTEAAVHMRAYLALQPNAKNAGAVKEFLDKIDQRGAEAKK